MKAFIPFSNGTEAMIWLDNNCDSCYKGRFYKRGSEPKDYRCRLYYWISLSMITGEMPMRIAKRIGIEDDCLALRCQKFLATKPKPKKKKITNFKLELWEEIK